MEMVEGCLNMSIGIPWLAAKLHSVTRHMHQLFRGQQNNRRGNEFCRKKEVFSDRGESNQGSDGYSFRE
jgi:hypothetical protein